MTLMGHRLCVLTFAVLLVLLTDVARADGSQAERAKEVYARAVELEAKADYPSALPLLWEAAGLAPRDAEIQNRLGEALDRLGALDAAIEAFRRALAERPDFRKAVNNLILTLGKAGKGREAVERAQALVAGSPGDPEALFTLGLAQSEQDITEAIATFRRVLALAPRHSLARYNLALVLKRADRLPEAIAELTTAIDTEPRAEAYYTLGVIYRHQGELARAAGALRAAVAAEPSYADAHYTLGVVLHAGGDVQGAERALRRAVAIRPDLEGAHYTLGRILHASGDTAAARSHLAEAERLRLRRQVEQEASVWTTVGTGRLEAGDAAAALDCFRRATAVFEAYAPAHYQMGRALERLGDQAGARAAFARARQLNPMLVPPRAP
jgi:tetratricopeptide (TPR) repeat protein